MVKINHSAVFLCNKSLVSSISSSASTIFNKFSTFDLFLVSGNKQNNSSAEIARQAIIKKGTVE